MLAGVAKDAALEHGIRDIATGDASNLSKLATAGFAADRLMSLPPQMLANYIDGTKIPSLGDVGNRIADAYHGFVDRPSEIAARNMKDGATTGSQMGASPASILPKPQYPNSPTSNAFVPAGSPVGGEPAVSARTQALRDQNAKWQDAYLEQRRREGRPFSEPMSPEEFYAKMDKADAQGAAQDRHLAEWQNSAQNQRARSEYPGRANSFGGPQKDLPSEVFTPIDGRLVGSNEDHRAPDRTQQQYDQAFAEFQAESKRPTNINLNGFGRMSGNMDPDTAAKISARLATAQSQEQTRRDRANTEAQLPMPDRVNNMGLQALQGLQSNDPTVRERSAQVLQSLPQFQKNVLDRQSTQEGNQVDQQRWKVYGDVGMAKAQADATQAKIQQTQQEQAAKHQNLQANMSYIDNAVNNLPEQQRDSVYGDFTAWLASAPKELETRLGPGMTDMRTIPTELLPEIWKIYQDGSAVKPEEFWYLPSPSAQETEDYRNNFRNKKLGNVSPRGEAA
jgi:hypothetical protein